MPSSVQPKLAASVMFSVGLVPGLKSVDSATAQPASMNLRASGRCFRPGEHARGGQQHGDHARLGQCADARRLRRVEVLRGDRLDLTRPAWRHRRRGTGRRAPSGAGRGACQPAGSPRASLMLKAPRSTNTSQKRSEPLRLATRGIMSSINRLHVGAPVRPCTPPAPRGRPGTCARPRSDDRWRRCRSATAGS